MISSKKLRLILRDSLAALRARGIKNTIAILISSLSDFIFSFFQGHGHELHGQPRKDGVSSRHFEFKTTYQPTRTKPFLELMKRLNLAGVHGRFVDFGSGKGRILRLARDAGFRKVRGIEFSANLCAHSRKIRDVETLHMDFSDYEVEADDTVFYFYDPAFGDPQQRAIENIARSLWESPRNSVLIYHNNVISEFPNSWIEILKPQTKETFVIRGNQFFVLGFHLEKGV